MKADWPRRPLGEVASLSGRIGWRGLTAKEYTRQGPRFLSVHSLNCGAYVDLRNAFHISQERYDESPEIMLREGDVLICKDGAGIGKVGIVGVINEPATINSSLLLIRSAGAMEPKFLYYCLSSPYFQRIVLSRLNGATTPHLYQRDITEFPVVVPARAEQFRIVAILDNAFDGIAIAKANAEKNLQNARELFSSRMQVLFEEDEAWECVQLEELLARGWITSHLDGNHGSDYPRKEEFVDAGVPYIAASAIKSGAVDFGEAKYLSHERAASIHKGLAKNRDVLFAHNATVGPVAVLSTDEAFVILGTSLTYYRCDPQHIHPEYLAHFMLSPTFTSQYAQVMKQSTRNQVPITKQREFFHVIPPIDVQRRIADGLDELSKQTQRLADLESRKLVALEELKKSLLHQAFNGALNTKTVDMQVAEIA